MPCKRAPKPNSEPSIPNFNEIMNFPLTISVEDKYGNYQKMFMDGKLNILPYDNKSNDDFEGIVIEPADTECKKLKSSNRNSNDKENINKLKSPNTNKENIKASSSRNLESDYNDDLLKSDVEFVSEASNEIKKIKRKSILKSPHPNFNVEKDKPNKKSHLKVMFSSPLVRQTPNTKSDMRKNHLIEQLKRCQETPILRVKSNMNKFMDDSSLHFTTDITPDQSLIATPIISEKKKVFGESPMLPNNQMSEVLFNEDEINVTSLSDANNDFEANFQESFHVVKVEDRKKWLIQAKRRSRWIKKNQGMNDSFWEAYNVNDSESVVLKLCEKESYQNFASVFPMKKRKEISKLGEGSFGEVFSIVDNENKLSVVKFIPVNGSLYYNGGPQTTFDDIISEIVVAKELSDLRIGRTNRCRNFVKMENVFLVCGKFPTFFQKEWDKSNKLKTSENDNPKKFSSSQKWILIQFEYAGCPLENFKIETFAQAYSILLQTCLSLACAEYYVEFEHRDLHWGNILVLNTCLDDSELTYMLNGKDYQISHFGVLSTIIDYTFSRIKKGVNLVYSDMSKDQDMFLGTGDPQFDVYRHMQQHNKNEWSNFNPKTNIFWLTYLGNKLADSLISREIIADDYKLKFDSLVHDISNSQSTAELITSHLG